MSAAQYETLDYDVVVIGGGGAGLRAAIEASAQGARTAIVCKSLLGKALTAMAQGGIAAAMGNVHTEDSWHAHFRDTMRAGRFLSDWRMAQIHAQESAERVVELESWGALFDRTKDGLISQRHFGAHRYARVAHRGDRTGLDLLRALQQHAVHNGIDVHMECTIQRLMLDDGRIAGAFGYWRASGKFVLFKSKAVILATGGSGRAWKHTSNPWESTGDGVALALEAGAQLMDMEFVQFHPTGMIWPTSARGILVTESARALGGTLRNAAGERFMFDYIPDFLISETAGSEIEADAWYSDRRNHRCPPDLLPPDEVARAIDSEIRAGRGTSHRGVFLDLGSRRPAETILRELPSLHSQFKRQCDVDITQSPMEVAPTCHYMMGGVRVNAETAASTVPGLYAAGEAAAGLHGASRLGGNSLSDLLVFGRRAGLHAAQYCRSCYGRVSVDADRVAGYARQLLAPFQTNGSENPYALHAALQDCMHSLVGVKRTESDLKHALWKIRQLRRKSTRVAVQGPRSFNPAWHLALDLHSLLTASEATTVAAIERKESRGSHARRDFPVVDPAYAKLNIVVEKFENGLVISREPVPEMPDELKRLVDWSKTWLAKKPASESGAAMQTAGNSKSIG
jgi:succinate dehydrogenase / fumarate reductase flavoprotein subunit